MLNLTRCFAQVFQVLYGRLSDLFGRKNIFVAALVLLSLSDLAVGLSVNSTMLYIFRGLAGIANGGIVSLSMMIVSDIVTLRERGKYQGILGAFVGGGNAIGPLIAAAFAIHYSWRGLFYMLAPLIMVSAVICWKWLPTNMPKLNVRQTIARIDFAGLITGTAAVILLLIPTSEGGHAGTPWNSPLVIAMFTVGGICFIAFLVIEWKWAELPMMPLGMFRKASVAAMMAQSFFVGVIYYSYIYFLPLYFQNVRGKSPLLSAAFQLPLVITQSTISTLAGLYMSHFNRYLEVVLFGFGIWTLGGGLLILANDHIDIGLVSFFLVICGIGTGCTFQPTLVALQAHCPKSQRAVVTSTRNFVRQGGAAVGLAVSSAIMANVLKSSFPERLESLADNSFAAPSLSGYSPEDQAIIKSAYAGASRAVFIFCTPLIGICFLLTIFVKDHGLVRKEDGEGNTPPQEKEEASSSAPANDGNERRTEIADEENEMKSTRVRSFQEATDASRTQSFNSEKSTTSKVP